MEQSFDLMCSQYIRPDGMSNVCNPCILCQTLRSAFLADFAYVLIGEIKGINTGIDNYLSLYSIGFEIQPFLGRSSPSHYPWNPFRVY